MKSIVRHASFLTVPILLSLVLATSVFAVGKPDGVDNLRAESHLTDAKLKSCQARENAIQNRSTHLVDLVTNMETKFEKIAKRVQDYYTSTVIPQSKTVSNYDTLVKDIQAKREAVQVTLIKVHQDEALNFDCTVSDPKAQMTQFREDMQAVKSALKDYRTAIKNLIVAVHSVTGIENKSPK